MSSADEIARVEKEIRDTPYNKATQHHIGRLKAKLARLREEEEKKKGKGKKKERGLRKEGDGTVVIIPGPTSFFDFLVNGSRDDEIRVGMMEHNGAKVELFELPENLFGKSDFFSIVRMADLILMVFDGERINDESRIEEYLRELYRKGIRVNRDSPNMRVKKKGSGGLRVISTVPQELKKEEIEDIAKEFYSNADIVLYESLSYDRLIDGLAGNRTYVPSILVRRGGDGENSLSQIFKGGGISSDEPINIKDKIIEKLGLIRVFLKDACGDINPMAVKTGDRVKDVCVKIHTDFRKGFKYAILDGPNAKYSGQRVGLSYELKEGDVISIKTRVV